MKKKSKFLIAIIIAIIGLFSDIYAQQSIVIKKTDGTLTQIPLTQVQKITFTETNMVLHKTDASTIVWATADIQKYYYDLASSIEEFHPTEIDEVIVYPNPSDGKFIINYQIEEKGKVNIYLVSIDSKTRKNLLSEYKEQGEYVLNVNQYLEVGSYFVKIESKNNFITKKLIILK